MKPTTLTIFELFEKERRHLVPLFQRPYVWKEDPQWAQLWDNVVTKADHISQADPDSAHLIRKHFLGAVVINQIKTFGRQVAAMEVIDGQQRLTTLQILLAAFRDYLRSEENDAFDNDLRRLTENTCRMEEAFERFKVWPTNTDREVFENVMTLGSPTALNERYPRKRRKYARKNKWLPRPKILEAYLYFYDKIEAYDTSDDDDEVTLPGQESGDRGISKLDALLEAFTRNMEVVVIELEDRDDPQVIFETLNAYGEPLLPSDLIRNFVFLEASRNREGVERLYETYWSEYDTGESGVLWKTEVRQGRLKRPRIDLFVFHYLTYQTQRDLTISHLFEEFRDWWHRRPRTVEEELKTLNHFSGAFKELVIPDPESRLGVFAERLQVLDTSTAYPLLLFLIGEMRDALPKEELEGMLTDLESYLVRRMICGLTPKNYNRVFLSLLQNLKKAPSVDRATLRGLLQAMEGESVRWPDDEEFEASWLHKPAYQMMRAKRVRMVLQALDLQMETSRQERVHLDGALTVEHVLPQQASLSDWPSWAWSQTDDELERLKVLAQRSTLAHTFGNLTLLTQPLNSSVSNGPFWTKRPEIAKQSRLRLNSYFQDFDNLDEWDVDQIVRRGEKLFGVARKIWPYPSHHVTQG